MQIKLHICWFGNSWILSWLVCDAIFSQAIEKNATRKWLTLQIRFDLLYYLLLESIFHFQNPESLSGASFGLSNMHELMEDNSTMPLSSLNV